MAISTWYCCRQRAGPLVKECRRTGVRYSPDDTREDHRIKSQLKRVQRCMLNRKPDDRLELFLALLGWTGTHYILTYDDDHLPQNFADVRKSLRAFLMRAARFRESAGLSGALDYLYAIEGLHGERRYHVHFVCRYDDLPPAAVRASDSGDWPGLWRNGIVFDKPVVMDDSGFRRLAEYLNKERPDGHIIPLGRHPWSCSRSLRAQLLPAQRWTETTGGIAVPDGAIFVRRYDPSLGEESMGGVNWARYCLPDGSRACARVCARVYGRGRASIL